MDKKLREWNYLGKTGELPDSWTTNIIGEYNPKIMTCDECDNDVDIFTNAVGFFDCTEIKYHPNKPVGVVVECPHCFEKYWFHADDMVKSTVMWLAEQGEAKFLSI